MKRFLIYSILVALLLPGCTRKATGSSVVIKPKTHNRFFDLKKDKHKKRTKLVRMKG